MECDEIAGVKEQLRGKMLKDRGTKSVEKID